MEAAVLKFWRDYIDSLPAGVHRQKRPADVFAFGDTREMADQLAKLVRDGVKTATCSALWSYEEDQKPLPQREDHSVVLDGNGAPVAVIETVEAESQAGEPGSNTLHGQKDCSPQDVSKEAASNLKVDPSFCS